MTSDSARAAYGWLVIVAGIVALAHAATTVHWSSPDPRWPILATLTLVGAVAMLKMRAAPVSFSISDTFTFTTLLLLGAAAATMTASLEALTISCFLSREQRRASRILFNVSAVGLAMWVTGALLEGVAGAATLSAVVISPARLTVVMTVAVGTYFLTNTWMVAIAVSFAQRQSVFMTWRSHFLHLGLNYFAGGYAALLLVLFAPSLDWQGFLLLAPMPLVLYTTLRLWLGRINDRVAHLDMVNRQYRATIEALAHAVDAKDQVTHGHIRRVQTACLQLARALGCRDEAELHAIEAASLLHDLGKLAIPEHILNKPGRLTAAEYARIKEHAAIGADIIAGVAFPYPVAPIVRHHHENWDGSGYPDGLAGEEIPLGARILAIVDCFDALTSDRPYRPAMSSAAAIAILRERRGIMYDPAIVDAFIAQAPPVDDRPTRVVMAPAPPAASATVHDTWRQVGDHTAFHALAGPVLMVACRTSDASAGVVFEYVEERDVLAPAVSFGFDLDVLRTLNMRSGDRLSGWVAANGRCQVDSDARLDLPGIDTPHQTALSVPIESGDCLVGVMTLYGGPGTFADPPLEMIQLLASAIALAPRSHAGDALINR